MHLSGQRFLLRHVLSCSPFAFPPSAIVMQPILNIQPYRLDCDSRVKSRLLCHLSQKEEEEEKRRCNPHTNIRLHAHTHTCSASFSGSSSRVHSVLVRVLFYSSMFCCVETSFPPLHHHDDDDAGGKSGTESAKNQRERERERERDDLKHHSKLHLVVCLLCSFSLQSSCFRSSLLLCLFRLFPRSLPRLFV